MVPLHFLRVVGYMLGVVVGLLNSSMMVVAGADFVLGQNIMTPVASWKPSVTDL